MKVNVGYPSREEELRILDRFAVADTHPVRAVATLEDVRAWLSTRPTASTSTRS